MNKQAKKVLTEIYWSSARWKKDRIITPEIQKILRDNDAWYSIDIYEHKKAIPEIIELVKTTRVNQLARNFISSLSTRELGYRSPLGSFAVHKNIKQHNHTKDVHCRICGTTRM